MKKMAAIPMTCPLLSSMIQSMPRISVISIQAMDVRDNKANLQQPQQSRTMLRGRRINTVKIRIYREEDFQLGKHVSGVI
jgi:hypothetical protein